MTLEEHLDMGKKWLEAQEGIVYPEAQDLGDEVFGFCNDMVIVVCSDDGGLYVCDEYCGEYSSVNKMVEGIVSGENKEAIRILKRNERLIEVADWCNTKIKNNMGVLGNYCKNMWVRFCQSRLYLMANDEDGKAAIRIGQFLGVGSDLMDGIGVFNEDCLDALDRLCEKGTVRWYNIWKSLWELANKGADYGVVDDSLKCKMVDDCIELLGDCWDNDKIGVLAKNMGRYRKVIEFDSVDELEARIALVS